MPKKQNKYLPIPLTHIDLIKQDPIANLMIMTGGRATEMVRIINNYNKDLNYVVIKRKGGAEVPVYLNKTAKFILDNNMDYLKTFKERTKISKHIKNLLVKNGLDSPRYVAHSTRATFATSLINNGVDLVTIQTLMNHADIRTTAAYIKLSELNLSIGVRQLDPNNTIEGMTLTEAYQEIIRLRKRVVRLESQIPTVEELEWIRNYKKGEKNATR